MSSQVGTAAKTPIPGDFGLVSDMGTVDLTAATKDWSAGASKEYTQIGDRLAKAAEGYADTEFSNAAQAGEVGR